MRICITITTITVYGVNAITEPKFEITKSETSLITVAAFAIRLNFAKLLITKYFYIHRYAVIQI